MRRPVQFRSDAHLVDPPVAGVTVAEDRTAALVIVLVAVVAEE